MQRRACLTADFIRLFRPYRRQASSHRLSNSFKTCGVPVGAGLPAIGPVLTAQKNQAARACRLGTASTSSTPNNAR
ncbi:hypothetical protein FCH73_25995 [Pseudomonas putida]|nr:hypothetical protein [Pseudomonas putida]NTY99818.1 hypothetical protein [Pseudomonas putida]NTZ22730.1 hypothetical protein [Pseudomonas putida]NTZ54922.1 hypothetical protein [Pseudomonas putida]NTZ69206.1 hypothetical protein [Pseudomonas putida]